MTDKEMRELTDRQIPGITWKQIAMLIGVMWILMMVYFNLTRDSEAGKKKDIDTDNAIKEFLKEYKQNNELKDAQIYQLKLEHREFDIRLRQLEKNWDNFIEGYNKANKKYK